CGDFVSGFGQPNRSSTDPAWRIEQVRTERDAFLLKEHPNRLDVLQWRADDSSGHSSPPDGDLGRAVDRRRVHLEPAERLHPMPSAAHEEAAKLIKAVDAVLDRHGQDVIQARTVSASLVRSPMRYVAASDTPAWRASSGARATNRGDRSTSTVR